MKYDLQGIFDALLEGVIVLDERGAIDFLNSEAGRLLELPEDIPPGELLTDALGSDHPVCEIVERVRETSRPAIHDEVEILRRGAPATPVDITISLHAEENKGQAGLIIALRDRSASQSLREEVYERERQESYGHIAAGIAHEVKNPLGGIRGAAELLSMRASDDRGRKAADLIVGEVDRITGLVDELMVFARGDRLEIQSVNVHQPLDALLDLLELERGYEDIEIKRLFDPSLPELEADPARLQQIFLNLARNAMQAMEGQNGTLTLSTKMSLEQRLIGPDGRPRPTIRVSFEDDGPGIPKSIRDRLATPFFTTKQKGTGLGLSVSRHWTRRHGGRLRIESVEGEGTRVDVDLPLTQLPAQLTPGAAAGSKQDALP
ncbi:MAG: nitrogen regulation protein NR(II) [Myxococcota bacterium]